MNSEIFEQIRDKTDIAEAYGVEIEGRMAHCPFHVDNHPSMSFKNNRFKCFSCGASGSVIDLTMQIHGIGLGDAVKKLNEDFSLGLMLGNEARRDFAKAEKQNREREEYKAFVAWEQWAFDVCVGELGRYEGIKAEISPRYDAPESELKLYAEALGHIDFLDYLVNQLIYGDVKDTTLIYKNYRKDIESYAKAGNYGSFKRAERGRKTGAAAGRRENAEIF